MNLSRLTACLLAALLIGLALHAASPPRTDSPVEVDFQRDVRPILSDNCFQCHGPDPATRMAGLRMDIEEGAFGERDNGTPIVPGDPESSLLYQRIIHENDMMRMPPAYSNKELEESEIATLKLWIEQGAHWDQHWAFQPLEKPTPPEVENADWVRNEIDRFVLARLEAEGLTPAPEADRHTLARRVSLDITGLPPSPGLVESFVNDTSENAYERLIDHLMDSGHWGEHRARYWLDAARYADTHGLHIDNYREMWPYRDWVIEAFNGNMPFDEFTIEQVAGDLLPNATLSQKIASGFHRNNVTTNEAGVITEEVAAMYAADRAETTGMVWMGLTVGCSTCHDHKFDPISQKDFYSLTAFFRNTTQDVMDGNVSDPPPIIVVPTEEDEPRWKELRKKEAKIEQRLDEVKAEVEQEFDDWLATGEYRTLEGPLDESSEILELKLGETAKVDFKEETKAVKLKGGAEIGEGPESGYPALHFNTKDSWAELPNAGLDGFKPFSITAWVLHPDDEGNFSIASRMDPEQDRRGWSLDANARVSGFRMIGEDPESVSYTFGVEIRAGHLKQMTPGEWSHIAVTYDGTGERAGLNYYLDGAVIPTQGSEFFTKLKGSIFTDQPIKLGRSQVTYQGQDIDRHFAGGAIADFRIFSREITVQEAELVTVWPVLERASEKEVEALTKQERDALRRYYLSLENEAYREILEGKKEIDLEQREIRRRGSITHVMQEKQDSNPEAHVLHRGMYDQPREKVNATTPAALPPMPASLPRNRLGLAKWLVHESNSLTPRVTVNRFWQQVFGRGIVKTADDFGSQGTPPTHPKLLDWLAADFREDWDIKRFFKQVLMSATYRQSAETTPEKLERDPDNELLSRGPRFRMDGEMIRDYALAASDLLVPKIGGPSVKPYQPEGVWETVAMLGSNTRHYEQDHGEKLYRRSVYTFWKRAAPPPSMDIFNAPTREHSMVVRERTNTPLQALVTMDDTQFVEACRHLGQNALREAGYGFGSKLDYMTLRLLARPFDEAERQVARETYQDLLAYYRENPEDAEELLEVGESAYDHSLPVAQSAAFTMLANQLMNLDEVLNK